jgi:hypothetical protein
MNMKSFSKIVAGLLLLAVVALGSGCASTEPQNRSARPWNAPKGWEGGLPVGLTEGR